MQRISKTNEQNNEVISTPASPALNIESEFLYTRSVPKPQPINTVKELRTVLRLVQLAVAIGAFVSLALSTVIVNYSYAVLSVSGVNFMCLVSLSSMFVSFSCIFLYFYPSFLGVPPHRHSRFSRIEVIVDLLYIGFWLSSSSALAFFGVSTCPRKIFRPDSNDLTCLSWNLCFGCGYVCALLFGATFIMGVRDLWLHGWFGSGTNAVFQGARGSWKEG